MVNVTDIPDHKIPTKGDKLYLMFQRQEELLKKYHPIEQKAGFHSEVTLPANINLAKDQALLKDFAWRVTEELGEASLAYHEPAVDGSKDLTHTQEELADAFHFLIELNLWAGCNDVVFFKEIQGELPWSKEDGRLAYCYFQSRVKIFPYISKPNFRSLSFLVTEFIAEAMNTLKQKPWKQTAMLTDAVVFHRALTNANMAFLLLCEFNGLGPDELFNMYFKKSEVNKFRIESKY